MLFAALVLLAAASSASAAAPSRLDYSVGQEFTFNTNGFIDARGQEWKGEKRTAGSVGTMGGLFVAQCTQKNASGFLFVFNMFDVNVGVSQGEPASSAVPGGENLKSLGDDMYFYQKDDGQSEFFCLSSLSSAPSLFFIFFFV
jgi:hypothetical protein